MLADDTLDALKNAVHACDEARAALTEALDAADRHDDPASNPEFLESVGTALGNWRDAQRRFMETIEAAEVSDAATAALLLKTNHGVDASNARCGIPGTDVDGADQPFPLDLTGTKGMVITHAASEHLE